MNYTAGAGIMIVAGRKVDGCALRVARNGFIYTASARPEMRAILQENHIKLSLFIKNASESPEYGPDMVGEDGVFCRDGRMQL